MTHTPTPWIVDDRTDKGQGYTIQSPSAHFSSCNVASFVGKADAEFILRACNAHDGWKAVKRLIVWLDKNHSEHEAMLEDEYEHAIERERHPNSEHILAELIEQTSAALAKACGEA